MENLERTTKTGAGAGSPTVQRAGDHKKKRRAPTKDDEKNQREYTRKIQGRKKFVCGIEILF